MRSPAVWEVICVLTFQQPSKFEYHVARDVKSSGIGEPICSIFPLIYANSWPKSRFYVDLYAHGSWTCIKRKKLTKVKKIIFVHYNVYRIKFQEIKIRPWEGFEKKAFSSLFLMRKRLFSGQKWFLRPYFPLIRGIFLLKSGLTFSLRALEVPEPKVRKRPLSSN